MSDLPKARLELFALLLSLVIGLAAAAQAWFTLPYRLEQAENAIKANAAEKFVDRELLVRIDERLQILQRDMSELKTKTQKP